MTLQPHAIAFRLKNLSENPFNYKNSEKELVSIVRVLQELIKEGERRNPSNRKIAKISAVLENIKQKKDDLRNNEMEQRQLGFMRGVDLNKSEIKDFKITNNTIFFPLTAISGIGEKVAEKIVNYRKEKSLITSNWSEELKETLNTNHLEQLSNLQKYDLLINL
ncbi:25133_t:CDS:2 [Cetraspora pellucida]|uniref:25133_t:CDS:1 n=1 Tax=Cetraspora pellucida TaxID=1433469 RepID=A0A9N9FBK7_9GLOM|nr:25133_t:CDS:2 [Cetraspora pellucida]